jgi:hypothetical protein
VSFVQFPERNSDLITAFFGIFLAHFRYQFRRGMSGSMTGWYISCEAAVINAHCFMQQSILEIKSLMDGGWACCLGKKTA